MPTLSRFNGIKILMYFRDHNPPHFHAHHGAHKAEVGLNGAIKNGSLPPAQLKQVHEWAAQHQAELQERWKSAFENRPFDPIMPLE